MENEREPRASGPLNLPLLLFSGLTALILLTCRFGTLSRTVREVFRLPAGERADFWIEPPPGTRPTRNRPGPEGLIDKARRIYDKSLQLLGGKAQIRVIVTLSFILAVNSADYGAVGAMDDYIEKVFNIGQTHLGLLVTASSVTTALSALLFGLLIDKVNRTRLLTISIFAWGGVMVLMASSSTYIYLLITRILLGFAIGAAVPGVASLIGDFFAPGERGRKWGYVLIGEGFGIAAGYGIAGFLAVISWRFGFLALAGLSFVLAWVVHNLPEPARGGPGLQHGQEKVDPSGRNVPEQNPRQDKRDEYSRLIRQEVREKHALPRESMVLDVDPSTRSLWWAIGYVLRIPTNVVLIIASALGYYLLTGYIIFGLEYFRGRFGFGHLHGIVVLGSTAAGELFGLFAGGYLGDRLIATGHVNGRVFVVVFSFLISGALFVPGFLAGSFRLAFPMLFLAFAALGAGMPALDAARLDIMHPLLWGRAEGIRMMLRDIGQGLAPLLFGFTSAYVFGGGTHGLEYTFLVMLIPLFAASLIGSFAFRTYPRDVLTAQEYAQRTPNAQS